MDGVRDSKTVNGVKHEYITQGGNVTLERWNDGAEKSLEFIYDNAGAPYSVIYTHGDTTETYYYILNQQGDVIRIVNASGTTKAEYTYDSWGNVLTVSNVSGCTIGTLNPIRYRGYYYDAELNMYYLQSRYYDPVVKRMLSADDENTTDNAELNDNNLFSYCDNNPVNRKDEEGDVWQLALAGGGAVNAGAAITAIGAITPVGWVVIGTAAVVTVGVVVYSHSRTHNGISYSKSKSKYDQENKKKKSAKKPHKNKKKKKGKTKREIKRPARRIRYNTRKKAFEAAKRAGKGRKPINHHSGRHFHPNVSNKYSKTPKGASSHDHYSYPKR